MTKRRCWTQWSEEQARDVLDEADRSGLSDPGFARTQGLHPTRLSFWRKRLGRPRPDAAASGRPTFVEVRARPTADPGPVPQSQVKVHLQNGRQVDVPLEVDLVALGRLLDAVEGRPC
jgi:hypothetical protein